MKKILALILAISMLLCAVPAMADAALGAPFSFDLSQFRTYFDSFYASSFPDKAVTWLEGDGTLTAMAEGMSDVILHLNGNGQVMYMTSSLSGASSVMNYDAGTKLGVSSALTAMATLMAETNDVAALQAGVTTLEADYNEVLACMTNSSSATIEQLTNGLASCGTLMGYPAYVSYRAEMSNPLDPTMFVDFLLAPLGTTFD